MEKYLETERLILRELTPTDRQNLFELDSDPEVMKYLTNGISSTHEEIEQSLFKILKMYERYENKFGLWAAIEKSTSSFIGWFHLRPCHKEPDNLERIELGYRLSKEFWKRGYATEGSLALIDKGFAELDVREVFATTMKKNLASQQVMKKVGLSFEKEFHDERFPVPDERYVIYNLFRDDYLK